MFEINETTIKLLQRGVDNILQIFPNNQQIVITRSTTVGEVLSYKCIHGIHILIPFQKLPIFTGINLDLQYVTLCKMLTYKEWAEYMKKYPDSIKD